jgi:hypothetical protein
MDDKTKNKIVGTIITGALISGGMGFLIAIFMPQPVGSYIGMIIGYAIGGASCGAWLILRKRK